MNVPCVIAIAGSDSGGGAGIQADVKTFAALGVHGLCVVTAVTAQNTMRVDSIIELPPEFVTKQLDTLMKDFDVRFAKTGMLSGPDIIKAVEAGARKYKLRLVVDPVMASASGSPLMREEAFAAIKMLISRAELVTPNIPEAEKLSGIKIRSKADMRMAARAVAKLGPKAVLIKGGHMSGKIVTDLLYSDGKFEEFSGPRITTDHTHGTGCSLASAITAELAKGADLRTAVINAREFLAEAIRGRLKVGRGVMPVNQMSKLSREAAVGRAVDEVWKATKLLIGSPKFANLIPEVGTNIVMALPGANQRSEVVGLSGRIVRSVGGAIATGFPELGGSEHVANVVLAAVQHDPRIRSAMNIRYSPENLRACKNLGLTVSSFDRGKEPKGVKTMEWGTAQAIKKTGKVPQVVFDRGGPGKEAMIRLLGTSPGKVARLALKVAGKTG